MPVLVQWHLALELHRAEGSSPIPVHVMHQLDYELPIHQLPCT